MASIQQQAITMKDVPLISMKRINWTHLASPTDLSVPSFSGEFAGAVSGIELGVFFRP
jgi:hypothetical protein